MVRKATNASVSMVEVEIDRPIDRAAKGNFIRSDTGTVNISGSGGTGTVVSNESSSSWYMHGATVHALGAAPGDVRVTVQVRDENDAVVTEGAADGVSGNYIPFPGVNVKAGWDVHASVEQDTSNTHEISVSPIFRKPSPGDPGGGGGSGDETVSSIEVLEDFERATPISAYTGDTGSYGTQTANVFWNSTAGFLDTSNTSSRHQIVSTSGLGDYPEAPFTLKARLNSSETESGTSTEASLGVMFGASDADNAFALMYDVSDGSLVLLEYSGGSASSVTDGGFHNWDYPGDAWFRLEVDVDESRNPSMKGKLVDDNGDIRATLDADIELKGQGVGWFGKLADGSTEHRYDYMTYEEN